MVVAFIIVFTQKSFLKNRTEKIAKQVYMLFAPFATLTFIFFRQNDI